MNDPKQSLETEVERLTEELSQAHQQFDLFFNHFLDAILVVDATTGRITKVNDSAVRFFLYPRDELVCSDFHMLFPPAKDSDEGHLVGNLRVHGHAFYEQAFLRSDGVAVVADLSAAMVMWQGHESILIILRDAAERKAFEERLHAAEEAEGRLEMIAELNHEINNPLQELLTRVELDGDDRYRDPVLRIADVLRRLREQEPAIRAVATAEPPAAKVTEETLEPCVTNAVLVVDDEPSIRSLLEKVLRRGMPMVSIDTAASGLEALEKFEKGHHELLVMDVSMPEMRGDEAFLRIMEMCHDNKWASPSVVFCTGYNTPATVRATVERDPKHLCLLKPVDMGNIIEAVKERVTG
jgi:PAS domain S-box-containing protein